MTTVPSPRRPRKVVITTSPAPSDSDSLRDSYFSQSTAPTSLDSTSTTHRKTFEIPYRQKTPTPPCEHAAIAKTLFDATCSASSVATYDSGMSGMQPLCREQELEGHMKDFDDDDSSSSGDDDDEDEPSDDEEKDYILSDPASLHIPPVLPPYRVASHEPPAKPSSPQDFAKLFPSLDRLTVRHDDLTPDGNMNLRVDTLVPMGHGRRAYPVQLFHLRMHDLARREFSLRRYCRDSGREVCNSKRSYAPAPLGPVAAARPALQRSMSSAIRTVTNPFHRSTASTHSKNTQAGSGSSVSDGASIWSGSQHSPPLDQHQPKTKNRLVPTNQMKLEFSNYARLDMARRGGRTNKRYEFEWWGHSYAWKRVIDKNLNMVTFHLVRDGHGAPVAHIVPEMRGPNQVLDDEMAGAWVTPCSMWISDSSVLDALTDVADVIISTGLMALVDDCIKERWQAKKPSHRAIRTVEPGSPSKRAIMDTIFHRRHSEDNSRSPGPLRFGRRSMALY